MQNNHNFDNKDNKEGNEIFFSKANYYNVVKDKFDNPKLEIIKTIEYENMPQTISAYYIINEIIDLKKSLVEYLYLVAFDEGGNVRGIFMISKGDDEQTEIYMKEIILDCLLCNAKEFVLIHNHPNNVDQFSNTDIANSKLLETYNETVFKACKIKYLDDLLITDKNSSMLSHIYGCIDNLDD